MTEPSGAALAEPENFSLCPAAGCAAELAKRKRVAAELKKEVASRHPRLNDQAHYIRRDAQGAFTQWTVLVPGPVVG